MSLFNLVFFVILFGQRSRYELHWFSYHASALLEPAGPAGYSYLFFIDPQVLLMFLSCSCVLQKFQCHCLQLLKLSSSPLMRVSAFPVQS